LTNFSFLARVFIPKLLSPELIRLNFNDCWKFGKFSITCFLSLRVKYWACEAIKENFSAVRYNWLIIFNSSSVGTGNLSNFFKSNGWISLFSLSNSWLSNLSALANSSFK